MSLPEEALGAGPGAQDHGEALAAALAWQRAGAGVAIATVVETWGSSPCPAGSTLVVDDRGHFEGSVSGGCVEGAVIERAQAVIRSGGSELLEFGVADEDAWAVGLACGGQVRIQLGRLEAETADGGDRSQRRAGSQRETGSALLERLLAERAARRPIALLTDLASGERQLATPNALPSEHIPGLRCAVDDALRSDRAQVLDTPAGRVFINPFNPPLRLAIVGAVHIAQHLARFAASTGYQVTVIDPRTAFASEARFPGVALSHTWPDEALAKLSLGTRDAVVTLTHDPKLDDPALACALASQAFYIGALGSRRTQTKRAERLRERGVPESAIARIHGPVGLDIGARSPAEIALSVLAQITEGLRKAAPGIGSAAAASTSTGTASEGAHESRHA